MFTVAFRVALAWVSQVALAPGGLQCFSDLEDFKELQEGG